MSLRIRPAESGSGSIRKSNATLVKLRKNSLNSIKTTKSDEDPTELHTKILKLVKEVKRQTEANRKLIKDGDKDIIVAEYIKGLENFARYSEKFNFHPQPQENIEALKNSLIAANKALRKTK